MLVNGRPFNAFANLEHAIRQVLHHWTKKNPGKELLLWADQICRNQSNNAERTSQVSIMRDIYRRGRETYICLSTATTSTSRSTASSRREWQPYLIPPRTPYSPDRVSLTLGHLAKDELAWAAYVVQKDDSASQSLPVTPGVSYGPPASDITSKFQAYVAQILVSSHCRILAGKSTHFRDQSMVAPRLDFPRICFLTLC